MEVSGIPTKSNCKKFTFFLPDPLKGMFLFPKPFRFHFHAPNQLLWPFFRPRSEELKVDPAPRSGALFKKRRSCSGRGNLGGFWGFGGL